jgi:hypothetical protein
MCKVNKPMEKTKGRKGQNCRTIYGKSYPFSPELVSGSVFKNICHGGTEHAEKEFLLTTEGQFSSFHL